MSDQDSHRDRRECPGDEIDLVDLFLIAWKRKLMIGILTLLATASGVGLIFIMPEIYEVTAILMPAKDADGRLVINIQTLEQNIVNGAYNSLLADKLHLPLARIPDFKVSNPRNTDLLRISVMSSAPNSDVQILNGLLEAIAADVNNQLNKNIELVKNRMKENQLEINSLQ